MYDGNLDPLDPVDQYLENETDDIPTTPQDEGPHKDGLFGRTYDDGFDPDKLGQPHGGGQTNALNDPVNDPAQPHGDHFDVVEQDPATGNTYHNRVYDPGLDGGADLGPGTGL